MAQSINALPEKVFSIIGRKDIILNLEIAEKKEDLKKGLSGRKFLKNNHGMLFDFKKETKASIWMKDTFISLDIMFLDKNFKVLAFYENTQPESLKIIKPNILCRYVIEIKGGFIEKYKIKIGNIFHIIKQ